MRLTYRDRTVPHTNAKGEMWEAYSDANYNEVINKLAAYEDAEEQGRLVRLPCDVGDMVYYRRGQYIIGDTVRRIIIDESGNRVVLDCHNKEFDFEDFGKSAFLTGKEAEAALKGETKDV